MRFVGLVLLYVLIAHCSVSGQALSSDQQLWLGVNAATGLKKSWTVNAQSRVRFTDNVTNYKGAYFYFSAERKFGKEYGGEISYRLSVINNGKSVRNYHRYGIAGERTFKWGGLKMMFRPMLQYQRLAAPGDVDVSEKARAYLRTRLGVKKSFGDRWDAYLYGEPFFRINSGAGIDWWQNSIGFKYRLTRELRLNPYFIWQPDYTHRHFYTNYIYGLDMEFKLGRTGTGKKPMHQSVDVKAKV